MPYLDNGSKVLSINMILSLHIQITQLTGPHWVVFGIELVKALEGLPAL